MTPRAGGGAAGAVHAHDCCRAVLSRVPLVLGIEVRHDDMVAELVLQVGEAIVVTFRQGIGDGFHGVAGVARGVPIDWAEDAVFGDGLEGFEEAEGFQDGASDCEVV